MEIIGNIFKSATPILIIGVVAFLGYWVKLIIDKNKKVKKAEGHIWVQIIPNAGTERNFMTPIQDEHGVQFARIPDVNGKVSDNSPRYVLGTAGAYPAIYPPNKPKFTQLTVRKITFYEGDTEPLSNITDLPIVSAQALTNMIQGVSANAEEIMQKLKEESDGTRVLKKSNPLMWLYVIMIVVGIICVVNLIMSIQTLGMAGMIEDLVKLVKQALGLG